MLSNNSKNFDKILTQIKLDCRFGVKDFYQKDKNCYELYLSYLNETETAVFKNAVQDLYTEINKFKTKQLLIVKIIDNNGNLFIFHNSDEVCNVIDIRETLQARFPESKVPYVSTKHIVITSDINSYAKTALKTALVLKEHFLDTMISNFDLTVEDENSLIKITYQFKWFQERVITETIVNSNRYYEMISFVHDIPHPDVQWFHFKFRDSNKGFYSELDLAYKNQMSPKETLETSDFIRDKLRNKFSHLPIY